ncbi:MAG: hypothetical protein AAGH46_06715 [Bacteroidota bacterium]
MKFKLIFLLPLIFFLQVGGCSDDEDENNDGNIESFVTFQGETNTAVGGCNVQSDAGLDILCNYLANYQLNGLNYGIAISNDGICRTATFNLSNDFEGDGNALFVLQITDNGIPLETFVGVSGTIDLVDSGVSSSMRFQGTIISLDTGVEETIEGFVQCPL